MWRKFLASSIGIVCFLPALLFNYVAWGGQWRCGLMGMQAIVGDLLAAIGVSIALAIWPFSHSAALERWPLLLATWAMITASTFYILFAAPDCPYAAR
mgnify:FL=1